MAQALGHDRLALDHATPRWGVGRWEGRQAGRRRRGGRGGGVRAVDSRDYRENGRDLATTKPGEDALLGGEINAGCWHLAVREGAGREMGCQVSALSVTPDATMSGKRALPEPVAASYNPTGYAQESTIGDDQ